jgi:hypothetical protein
MAGALGLLSGEPCATADEAPARVEGPGPLWDSARVPKPRLGWVKPNDNFAFYTYLILRISRLVEFLVGPCQVETGKGYYECLLRKSQRLNSEEDAALKQVSPK